MAVVLVLSMRRDSSSRCAACSFTESVPHIARFLYFCCISLRFCSLEAAVLHVVNDVFCLMLACHVSRGRAEKDGPVHARKLYCACSACIMFLFDQCTMAKFVGPMRVRSCPLLNSSQLHRPQLRSLQEFADDLCANMIVAVRVARDERGLEHGRPYWLAYVLGPAFTAPTSMLHAGDQIEEGWLVVEIQWFEMVDDERRAYRLNPEKKLLVVNTLVRLLGIKFEPCAGPRVTLRSGRGHGQMCILSEDMHYAIMYGLGED